MITYREKDKKGKTLEVKRRLIFPEISDSHYRQITLPTGKKLWVYHTFYPFQIDLNYSNPAVLKESYSILSHWANQGVDLFRLDAIPFLDKSAENAQRTHAVVQLMSRFLRKTAPEARLEVEACQPLDQITRYFGKDTDNGHSVPSESQMAYQFEGMSSMSLALESGKKRYYDRYIRKLDSLHAPKHAIWAQFLRVHDELTLEMVPDKDKPILRQLFETGRGRRFRGADGVAGRLADFLGRDPDRIRMAYSLLMSQDGMPVIYYGDEIAAKGNPEFVDNEEHARSEYFKKAGIDALGTRDERDFGRGPIDAGDFRKAASKGEDSLAARTYRAVHQMLTARKESLAMRRGTLKLVSNNQPNILTYTRTATASQQVLVVSNLSADPTTVDVSLPEQAPSTKSLQDLLTGKGISVERTKSGLKLRLKRYGTYWLKLPPAHSH